MHAGHWGSGAARHAADHMVQTLESNEHFKQYVASTSKEGGQVKMLETALRETFLAADELIRADQAGKPEGQDKSGCTSVVACISPEYIVCANAGDSRCVMGTGGATKPLSEDHKPTDEKESKRVAAAGGSVWNKRVDGDLAVSRALGDFEFKERPDLPAEQQKVRLVGVRRLYCA